MADPLDIHGSPSDLASSVNQSYYFTDSDDVDIIARLGGNPGIHRISDLPTGEIPDILRPLIMNHQEIRLRPQSDKRGNRPLNTDPNFGVAWVISDGRLGQSDLSTGAQEYLPVA